MDLSPSRWLNESQPKIMAKYMTILKGKIMKHILSFSAELFLRLICR